MRADAASVPRANDDDDEELLDSGVLADEGPPFVSDASPDADSLLASLLGELQAQRRTSLSVLVGPDHEALVSNTHVKAEHDRRLFAAALLEAFRVPSRQLVATQQLVLRGARALGRDGRPAPWQADLVFRFLQIVVHDEEAARTVAAHAASRSADNPRAGLGMQVPVYDVVFVSVLHACRMRVPVRVCLSGDERFLLPPDQGALLRQEGAGQLLQVTVSSLPERMLSSMSDAVAVKFGSLLCQQLSQWWQQFPAASPPPAGVSVALAQPYLKKVAEGHYSCGGVQVHLSFETLPSCVPVTFSLPRCLWRSCFPFVLAVRGAAAFDVGWPAGTWPAARCAARLWAPPLCWSRALRCETAVCCCLCSQ